MFNFSGTYTDQYQLTMSQVYFLKGQQQKKATFDYFFRKLPFHGGFAVFAGLETVLDSLENFRFSEEEIEFLKKNNFQTEFLDYLKNFRFTGNIRSLKEGEIVFPNEPILQVEANIIEAQIIETFLLNILNFQTLIATKASRIFLQAKGKKLIDFGLRRAQGPGGFYASRAAIIGGFEATSNVSAGKSFNIPLSGTMAHSFIQSYDDELTAFRDFAEINPENTILLVDTYNTLQSGIPNAITVGKELETKGKKLKGIRLDSGDLAYLSRAARKILDGAGLEYVQIAVSNQLDEHLIKSLLDQEAPIDVFGVGTNLVTGNPDAALDGVYKLSVFDNKPRLKLSETVAKVTLPHNKQVYRIYDKEGDFAGADVITMEEENIPEMMLHPFDPLKSLNLKDFEKEALLEEVLKDGKRTQKSKSLEEIAEFSRKRLQKLPLEFKRFFNPHIYKVGLSKDLKEERDKIREQHKSS